MNNRYTFVALLLAVLTPLMSVRAQSDCNCTVTATSKNGKNLAYSGNCDNLQPGCTLTLKSGIKNADFSRFTDLSGVRIVIESKVNNPVFLGTSISSATTVFDFQDDPGTTLKVINEEGKTVTYSDNRGKGSNNVDSYNQALSACPSSCDLNNPSTPRVSESVLPVTLLAWEITPVDGTVVLDWQTADEADNDFFRVLHSTDGVSFTPVAEINGRGTTDFISTYRFAHTSPATGSNYYQLEQVDYDGTTTLLGVRSVRTEAGADAGAELRVYPNPVSSGSVLNIRNYPEERHSAATAELIGLTGRVVASLPLGPDGQLTLPGELTSGVYLLRIASRTTRLVVRP